MTTTTNPAAHYPDHTFAEPSGSGCYPGYSSTAPLPDLRRVTSRNLLPPRSAAQSQPTEPDVMHPVASPWPHPLDKRLTRSSTLLVLAAMAAAPHSPQRNTDLVRDTQMQRQDIGKTVRLLTEHGLARIEGDPGDGRARLYSLTDRGYACATSDPLTFTLPPAATTDDSLTDSTPGATPPPHLGSCPARRDCDQWLSRPSTVHILCAISEATADRFTTGELAQTCKVSHSHTVAVLYFMAQHDIVVREFNPSDGRAPTYRLTSIGHAWVHGTLESFPNGLQPGCNELSVSGIHEVVMTLRAQTQGFVSATAIQQVTQYAHRTVGAALTVLIHRGLITYERDTTRGRPRRWKLTTPGHAWLARRTPKETRQRARRHHPAVAAQRERVVAAMIADLSTPPPLWSGWMPSAIQLAQRYRVSTPTIRSAQKILETDGLITRGRAPRGHSSNTWAYKIIDTGPIEPTNQRSDERHHGLVARRHSTPRHPLGPALDSTTTTSPSDDQTRETPDPDSPVDQPEHMMQPGCSRHDQTAQGDSPERRQPSPPCDNDAGLPPTMFRNLRRLIAFGAAAQMRSTHLAVLYDVDVATITDCMHVFETLGAVTREMSANGIPCWSPNPSWTLRATGAAVRRMIVEVARRIETGWYRWVGLDGAIYQRPFPTLGELARQFRSTKQAARQVVAELHHLTYVRADTATPPNLDSATGHELLQQCADASLVINAEELRAALDAMPRSWLLSRWLGAPGGSWPDTTTDRSPLAEQIGPHTWAS